MGRPTADDPLGQRPDPADAGDMLNALIDARIEQRLRGRSSEVLNGVSDLQMVNELLARGWAVFKPALKG